MIINSVECLQKSSPTMGAAFCDSDPDKKYILIQIFSPRQSQQVLCSKIRTTLDFCSFSSRGEGHSFFNNTFQFYWISLVSNNRIIVLTSIVKHAGFPVGGWGVTGHQLPLPKHAKDRLKVTLFWSNILHKVNQFY